MSPEAHPIAIGFIDCDGARTIPGLFRRRVESSPHAPAYRQYEDGVWRGYTWAQTDRRMRCWQRGLAGEGLAPGDRVALSLRNGLDWVCFDQAAMGLGLVVVPLYTTDSPDNLAHILGDSGARLLLMDSQARWQRLADRRCSLPALERVLCIEGAGDSGDPRVRLVSDWLPAEPGEPVEPAAEPDALATLVYTSGTTGPPKGVMLSHRAILWDAEAVLPRRRIPARPSGSVPLLPACRSPTPSSAPWATTCP